MLKFVFRVHPPLNNKNVSQTICLSLKLCIKNFFFKSRSFEICFGSLVERNYKETL